MQNRMRWCAVLVWAMLLMVSALPVARAQDGDDDGRLGEVEIRLIERVAAAHQSLDTLDSYVETANGTFFQEVSIKLLGQVQSAYSRVTWERYTQLVQGADMVNISALINATVQETLDVGPGGVRDYVVSAEARQIGRTLYVQAKYEPPRPGLPLLPTGWQVIANPGELDVYRHLELGDLLGRAELVDDADVMRAAAAVEQAPGALDDGTPVDVITITFDAAGIVRALDDPAVLHVNPGIAGILAGGLSADSTIVLEVVLGLDDTPYAFRMESLIQALNIDAHALAPNEFPQGVWLSIVLETSRHETYRDFNAPLTPVEAPDMK